jgi:hypothetical protein
LCGEGTGSRETVQRVLLHLVRPTGFCASIRLEEARQILREGAEAAGSARARQEQSGAARRGTNLSWRQQMNITLTNELTVLALAVETADHNLGVALGRLNEFRAKHPEYSGMGIVLRSQTDSPLDVEHRNLQNDVNKARNEFAAACQRYADAKPTF